MMVDSDFRKFSEFINGIMPLLESCGFLENREDRRDYPMGCDRLYKHKKGFSLHFLYDGKDASISIGFGSRLHNNQDDEDAWRSLSCSYKSILNQLGIESDHWKQLNLGTIFQADYVDSIRQMLEESLPEVCEKCTLDDISAVEKRIESQRQREKRNMSH